MHVPGLGAQDTTHFVVGLKGVLITRVRFRSVEYLDPLVAHTNGQANAIVDEKTGAFKMEPLNRSYSDEYWPGVHSARPMGGPVHKFGWRQTVQHHPNITQQRTWYYWIFGHSDENDK